MERVHSRGPIVRPLAVEGAAHQVLPLGKYDPGLPIHLSTFSHQSTTFENPLGDGLFTNMFF